jgi:hypothetical protein
VEPHARPRGEALRLNGEDYRSKPLSERKQRLLKLLRRAYGGIEYVEHLEGDGPIISNMPASWAWKASSRSASTCAISTVD